jgi:hypothetical protein
VDLLRAIDPSWLAVGSALLATLMVWLGWKFGPAKQIQELEVKVERLQDQVKEGWGDNGIKTVFVPRRKPFKF